MSEGAAEEKRKRRSPLSGWRTEPVVSARVRKARAKATVAVVEKETVVEGEAEKLKVGRRSPKPSHCTRYVQGRVASDLPLIVDQLLKKSKKGDAATLKALWQMGQLDRQVVSVKKQKSGLARELLKKLGSGEGLRS